MQTGFTILSRLGTTLEFAGDALRSGLAADIERANALLLEAAADLRRLTHCKPDNASRAGWVAGLEAVQSALARCERLNAAGATTLQALLGALGHSVGYDGQARPAGPGPGVTLQARG
jgi:hypothetical protein